jgi:hypothetical protein
MPYKTRAAYEVKQSLREAQDEGQQILKELLDKGEIKLTTVRKKRQRGGKGSRLRWAEKTAG